MRAWTTSACVVLAWTLMLAALAAAGLTGSARPAQAATRTTHSTTTSTTILTSIHNAAAPTAPTTPAAPAAPGGTRRIRGTGGGTGRGRIRGTGRPGGTAVAGPGPVSRYVVQPGDSLSGIAARFGIQGGWPPLYASNLKVIGWNPDVLHPGAVLVLPGPARARYTITAGDTLSRIAAGLGIAGGWRGPVRRQPAGDRRQPRRPAARDRAPAPPPGGRAPLGGDAQHAPRTTACARAAACARRR